LELKFKYIGTGYGVSVHWYTAWWYTGLTFQQSWCEYINFRCL